jgi:hypothetical protein
VPLPAKAPYFGIRRISYVLSVGVVLAIALAVSFWIPSPSAPTLSPIADAHTPSLSPSTVEDGFEPIFDGKTLDGWDGKKDFWSVQDGAITGEATKNTPTGKNTVIIYRKSEVADFELKLDYCILSKGANSGIQYRSEDLGNYVARGYQADLGSGTKYSGILYGELTGRGIMAHRGMRVWIGDGKVPKKTEKFAEAADLQKQIKGQGEWNEYHIIVKGKHFIHKINGHLMTEAHDESADFKAKGILALQLHAGGPMKLQFRNIRLKTD